MTTTVVIPSRGRPQRAREAAQALRDTAALVATSVIIAVDEDDPEWRAYQDLRFRPFGPEITIVTLRPEETGNLVRATNTVSLRVAETDPHCIIGNLGDDHVCRTDGWDRLLEDALRTPGMAYGDDLLQGERLPTAPFISAEIVTALGWFFVPTLIHMYVDDAVKALGNQLGLLRYVPDLVIEHLHPGAGKADLDAGYDRADASTSRDLVEYTRWRNTDFYADVDNVRRALSVTA